VSSSSPVNADAAASFSLRLYIYEASVVSHGTGRSSCQARYDFGSSERSIQHILFTDSGYSRWFASTSASAHNAARNWSSIDGGSSGSSGGGSAGLSGGRSGFTRDRPLLLAEQAASAAALPLERGPAYGWLRTIASEPWRRVMRSAAGFEYS
jgi:hypothetical protein